MFFFFFFIYFFDIFFVTCVCVCVFELYVAGNCTLCLHPNGKNWPNGVRPACRIIASDRTRHRVLVQQGKKSKKKKRKKMKQKNPLQISNKYVFNARMCFAFFLPFHFYLCENKNFTRRAVCRVYPCVLVCVCVCVWFWRWAVGGFFCGWHVHIDRGWGFRWSCLFLGYLFRTFFFPPPVVHFPPFAAWLFRFVLATTWLHHHTTWSLSTTA